MHNGFLGTLAPFTSDLVLLLEIVMGMALLFGVWLARRGRYRQHAWCQSSIVLLNLAVIVLTMLPAFRAHVLPKIPARLGRPYYLLTTVHGTLGSAAEFAGIYTLLAASRKILPAKFRLTNFKPWMRTVLALWWIVLLLGIATYARWYIPPK